MASLTNSDGGTHLALDFVNTFEHSRARRRDLLANPEDVVTWLDHAGLLDAHARAAVRALPLARVVHEEAHRLRSAVRELFRARSEGVAPATRTLYAVNRILELSLRCSTLEPVNGGLTLRHYERSEGPTALLAPVALAAANLVTTVDPRRLRECAAAPCGTWFVDSSKGGRRRWCSMARCGNRTKAARHRRRRATAL